MRFLFCGDRRWDDRFPIGLLVRAISSMDEAAGRSYCTVIEGEARGADQMAGKAADHLGVTVERFPANWDRYGRGAGPIRNQQMLDEGRPDVVFAFHDDIAASKGTRDMCERAAKAGKKVYVVGRYQPGQARLRLDAQRPPDKEGPSQIFQVEPEGVASD